MEVNNNPFYELRNRLYAAAAAGCSLIGEDFRLQRAIEAFKPMSETNKVFGKLYNMCSALIQSAQPAAEISDCIALADALAVTQGTFADHSETSPVEPNSSIIPAKIPYMKLAEYKAKIRKCRNSEPEFDEFFYDSIHDARLLNTFLEIADSQSTYVFQIEEAFTGAYGDDICMPLLNSIDFSNPKANGQQIGLISQVSGAKQNKLYISVAENENNPQGVRIAALKAMSCSIENEDLLFKIYKTEKGKIKTTALWSLAVLGSEKADAPLMSLIGKSKISDADIDIISASSGTVCLDYINQQIDFCIERGASVKYPIKMLQNKASAFDCFMKIAEYCMKDIKEEETAPYLVDINQVLVTGLYYQNKPEYREMIEKLYEAKPKFFFTSKLFMEFLDHPESACNAMNDGNQTTISDILDLINHIYFIDKKQYKLEYGVKKGYSEVAHEELFKPVFTSIPDDIISFLADTTGIHKEICIKECNDEYKMLIKNAEKRIDIFEKLLEECLPADKEKLQIAANDYAWTIFDSEAKFYVIPFLVRFSGKPLKGVIKNCVYTALKYDSSLNISSYYYRESVLVANFFARFDDQEELLISELQELIKELPECKEFNANTVSSQLDIIYKVLGRHGIVYAEDKK